MRSFETTKSEDDDNRSRSEKLTSRCLWTSRAHLPGLVIAILAETASFVEWKLGNISGRQAPVACVPTGTGRTASAVSETPLAVNTILPLAFFQRYRVRARQVVARTIVAIDTGGA